MNAVAAFENRKDTLRAQLEESENMPQAISAATMTLEQIACDLAQDEQDDFARQRQQAVMALAKRLPLGLRASRAKAQIVLEETQEQPSRVRRGAVGAGAVMLAALAVYEAVNGRMNFALLQALGALLMLFGANGALTATTRQTPRAQAETVIDAADMVREVGEICQAADLCAADLALIEQDNAPARLSGTADEAMLDLLSAMMEARASGRQDLALRSLDQAEQYLRMLGVQSVFYDAEHAGAVRRAARPKRRADGSPGAGARRGAGAPGCGGGRADGREGGVNMKILGFDLGDGESAVTLLDEDSTVEPRVMPLCGKNSLISAVGVKDGRIVIGEAASVTDGAAEAKVRFKSRYLTDPAASADVRAFAQGVMNELVRTQPALMAEVSRTVVGCPAGWGDGRREQYAALLESAGFPNVSVVPEPRAAFLYARHARGLRVSPELMKKSAMVIDIGSSTTDFAYIVDGRQQNVSLFGDTNLGGGLIDERILAHALAASKDGKALRAVFAGKPRVAELLRAGGAAAQGELFPRRGKVGGRAADPDADGLLRRAAGAGAFHRRGEHPRHGGRADRRAGRAELRRLSSGRAAGGGGGQPGMPAEVVILTGGASRMAFFQQAAARRLRTRWSCSAPSRSAPSRAGWPTRGAWTSG